MKGLFIKHVSAFKPADQDAEQIMRSVKHGDLVRIEVRRDRSPQNHRHFFAVLNLVVENNERWVNVDQLLTDIKLALGYTETRTVKGREFTIPRSISFSKMDEVEFRAFKDGAMALLEQAFPGVTAADWEREARERMVA